MTGTKAERLAEVERLYEAKRRALELEFGYEREKLAILLEEEDEEERPRRPSRPRYRFEAAAEEAPAAPAENPPTLSSSDLPYYCRRTVCRGRDGPRSRRDKDDDGVLVIGTPGR